MEWWRWAIIAWVCILIFAAFLSLVHFARKERQKYEQQHPEEKTETIDIDESN